MAGLFGLLPRARAASLAQHIEQSKAMGAEEPARVFYEPAEVSHSRFLPGVKHAEKIVSLR